MKRFALMVFLMLALASPAFALNGVGDISAYSDDQGNSCEFINPAGLVNVHLIHKFKVGEESTGARFKVVFPAGMVFVAFIPNNALVPGGNLLEDMTIGYGGCQTAQLYLGSGLVNAAAPAPCSYISLGPSNFTGLAQATDCIFEEKIVGIGQAIANPEAGCQCNIATEQSTWGKVKSLYR